MALETGLRTLLLAQSGITSLVPAQTIDGTSYPAIFNEHPKRKCQPPYIVIKQAGFDPYETLTATTGLESFEFQIDCCAVEYQDALAIAKAVSDFLKDYSGAAGSDTIQAVNWLSKQSSEFPESQGRDVRHQVVSLQFQIQAT